MHDIDITKLMSKVYIPTSTEVHTRTQLYVNTQTHTHTHVNTCIHATYGRGGMAATYQADSTVIVCHIYIHIWIHVYTNTHTHTHTHIYLHTCNLCKARLGSRSTKRTTIHTHTHTYYMHAISGRRGWAVAMQSWQ